MSSGPGQVVVVGRAQEAEAVGQDLEHALAADRSRSARSAPAGWRRSAPACASPPRPRCCISFASAASSAIFFSFSVLQVERRHGRRLRRRGSSAAASSARLARAPAAPPRTASPRRAPCVAQRALRLPALRGSHVGPAYGCTRGTTDAGNRRVYRTEVTSASSCLGGRADGARGSRR